MSPEAWAVGVVLVVILAAVGAVWLGTTLAALLLRAIGWHGA